LIARVEPPRGIAVALTFGVRSCRNCDWLKVETNQDLGSLVDPVLTPHDCLMALGLDELARGDAYRKWLQEAISDEELAAIRQHLAQERALGSLLFQQMVEKTLERPVSLRPRGRPARLSPA